MTKFICLLFILISIPLAKAQMIGFHIGLPGHKGTAAATGDSTIPNNAMTFNGAVMTFNGSTMTFTHS